MRKVAFVIGIAMTAGCGGSSTPQTNEASKASTSTAAHDTTAAKPAGPIDVCGIITPADAAALLGPLPMQPPSKTDHAGFGVDDCMYLGPALGGEGAQTHFARLTVQAGRSSDAADMLQGDAERRKATAPMSGVGDSAKRNEAGMFVWATKGGVSCTAEIAVGLPPSLTADSAATGLGSLCAKVFAAVNR